MTTESKQENPPLEWIFLELEPLPHISGRETLQLWWNPERKELLGEGVETILTMIDQALQKGSIGGGNSQYEITDPLAKPTELAVILAQFYWVIPQPVSEPGEIAGNESPDAPETDNSATTLQ
ncbi:hypothetical protein [Thiomicrorhabdus xiamenensis]|uniref:Uncharacterized protein n=1 Tax=Thiomicrorhabdus xiamenensis TaxID=2739063 RepID=A0A7D4NKY1_9GAMM|nr:hypothetical protein [Thiomicrorhabdus xiamenensis]QKI88714.1 hypothetical protein HQN79_03600 [Thiomicrorhabdus xiamenensis]